MLKTLLPDSRVVGTQVSGSPQRAIAEVVAEEFGFDVADDAKERFDLLFASEFFEHFEEPVECLTGLLEATNPRVCVVANTFTSQSTGHFRSYVVGGRRLDGASASRTFNDVMRERGFFEAGIKVWNGRPKVWVRSSVRGPRTLF